MSVPMYQVFAREISGDRKLVVMGQVDLPETAYYIMENVVKALSVLYPLQEMCELGIRRRTREPIGGFQYMDAVAYDPTDPKHRYLVFGEDRIRVLVAE